MQRQEGDQSRQGWEASEGLGPQVFFWIPFLLPTAKVSLAASAAKSKLGIRVSNLQVKSVLVSGAVFSATRASKPRDTKNTGTHMVADKCLELYFQAI